MRIAISVALLMVSASGADGQRRGAFIAGPPYAGRPAVPAVTGTPWPSQWSSGATGAPWCCSSNNQINRGFGGSHEQGGGANTVAIPVPVPVLVDGGDAQPPTPEGGPTDEPAPYVYSAPTPEAGPTNEAAPYVYSAPTPEAGPADEAAPAAYPAPVMMIGPEVAPPDAESAPENPMPIEVPERNLPSTDVPERPYVLIALKDGWIYVAAAYWVTGNTLYYITNGGDHNQVSLKLVDRKLSARLNQGSPIQFVIP